MNLRYLTALLGLWVFPSLHASTIFLVSEGTISQASGLGYPLADAGDSFRISVSYPDSLIDSNPSESIGTYVSDNVSITFEIPGEGTVFQSFGGSVNVSTTAGDFPVYSIASRLNGDGDALFLVFSDIDRSSVAAVGDSLPTTFGAAADYDSIGFAIVHFDAPDVPRPPTIPGSIPINLVDGTIHTIAIPEPTTTSLFCFSLVIFAVRRRNPKR
jgi:hypothetical protein